MESKENIQKKYNDIIKRSFKTKLDLFLFSKCHLEGGIENISQLDFELFAITDDLIKDSELAWTLGEEERFKEIGRAHV
jgi:hypothetical protein